MNRHFAQWQVARAFALEHTTLQYRLADEFEVLEAPDILALNNKTSASNASITIGQSINRMSEEESKDSGSGGMEFEESK